MMTNTNSLLKNLAQRVPVACAWLVAIALLGCSPMREDDNRLAFGEAEHTLVMYLNANNNLASSIIGNAYDAERGMMGALPSARLVIYLDKKDGSSVLYEVSYLQYGSSNYMKHTKVLKEYPEQTSTSPEVMKRVFEDIKVLVPSRSYGLVYGGHGSGWFPEPSSGVSYDNQKGLLEDGVSATPNATVAEEYSFGFLSNPTPLTRAMGYDGTTSNFTTTEEFIEGVSPIRFDYILFDACFMASLEFLYELRDVTDYVIASPVEVMGKGMPYEEIMPLIALPNRNMKDVCAKILEVYRDEDDSYNFSSTKSAALTMVDCSKLDALTQSVAAVWNKACGGEPKSQTECVALIKERVNEGSVQVLDRMSPAGFYDLKDFVEELAGDDCASELAAFDAALQDAIVFYDQTDKLYSASSYGDLAPIEPKQGSENVRLCGLSCYFPRESAPVTQSWYFGTSWAQIVYDL